MSWIRQVICALTTLGYCSVATFGYGELVAHWPLDEGSGETFVDMAGGNDGFLPQDVTVEWADDGPPGFQDSSVRFTGNQGPSYIETPFIGIGGANPRTITAWIKAEPQPFATAMVAWGSLANGRKWHFRINQGTNSLRTEFQGGQNFAGTELTDGEWHFVSSVFPEGAVEGAEILHYLDGVLDPRTGGTSREIDTGAGASEDAFPVHIGFAAGHAGRFFVGQIADVRIFDEGLSQEEIIAIGGGPSPGITQGDFNEDGTIDLADYEIIRDNFRSPSRRHADGNFDFSGPIDLQDFQNFVATFNSNAAAVPEPSAMALAFLAGLGLFGLGVRVRRTSR